MTSRTVLHNGVSRKVLSLLAVASLPLAGCQGGEDGADSSATEGDVFYEGETIELIVPFGAGGGTDVFARLAAPYLEEHIEGSPEVVVQNVPGGGTREGINQFARQDPDGLTIGLLTASGFTNPVLAPEGVEYDLEDMTALASFSSGFVVYGAAGLGLESPDQLRSIADTLIYGGVSPATEIARLLSLRDVVDGQVDGIFGFDGGAEVTTALVQGELDITSRSTPGYLDDVTEYVEDGEIVPLAVQGMYDVNAGEVVRDPSVPDVPTFGELYEEVHGASPSGSVWDVNAAYAITGSNLGRAFMAHGEAPDEAREALVSGFEALRDDTAFMNELAEQEGETTVLLGDEVDALVSEGRRLLEENEAFIQEALAEFE